MSTFVFKLPFTDIGGTLATHQGHEQCDDFELRYVECVEAYGYPLAHAKCNDLYEDFKECVGKFKQIARVDAMRAERKRQYWAGERTKENLYSTPPKDDVK